MPPTTRLANFSAKGVLDTRFIRVSLVQVHALDSINSGANSSHMQYNEQLRYALTSLELQEVA